MEDAAGKEVDGKLDPPLWTYERVAMRIFYRHRDAWLDPAGESSGLEAQEREALAIFSAALPNVPTSIDLSDGMFSYQLMSNDRVDAADEATMVAEYQWCTNVESPLPWPAPTEEK